MVVTRHEIQRRRRRAQRLNQSEVRGVPEVNIALDIPTGNANTFQLRRLSPIFLCVCFIFWFAVSLVVLFRSQQNSQTSHECHNTSDRTTLRQSRSSSGLQSGADDPAGDQHVPCWHRGQVTVGTHVSGGRCVETKRSDVLSSRTVSAGNSLGRTTVIDRDVVADTFSGSPSYIHV